MYIIKILSQVPTTGVDVPTVLPIWLVALLMIITAIIGFWKEIRGTFENHLNNKNGLELEKIRLKEKDKENLTCQERIDKLESKLQLYKDEVNRVKTLNIDYKIIVASLKAFLPLFKILMLKDNPDYAFMVDNFEESIKLLEENEKS